MEHLSHLLEKYKAGKCTPQELEILDFHFHHFELDPGFTLQEDEISALKTEMW